MKTCEVNPISATYGPQLFVVKELTLMRAGALPSCAMDLGGLCEEFQGGVDNSTRAKQTARQKEILILHSVVFAPKTSTDEKIKKPSPFLADPGFHRGQPGNATVPEERHGHEP